LKKEKWANPRIVHTGQHYDLNMSDVFFQDLGLPEPDIHLGVGSGTHAEQTGQVMIAYEKILSQHRPDLVVVVGDVNSTMACTIAASKISYLANTTNPTNSINPIDPTNPSNSNISTNSNRPVVAHLEAGLRSFDRTMPEEINRLVTDSLADILWTPSPDGDENLIREGVAKEKIERVGNIMIDSLEMMRGSIERLSVHKDYNLEKAKYGLVTLHRPSNVDEPDALAELCEILRTISEKLPLIFPIHPRTRKNLERFELIQKIDATPTIILTDPLNYISFMNLVFNCQVSITDSGGIQEETTYLGIPCLTLRPNTERPVTISQGTNRLCKVDNLEANVDSILKNRCGIGSVPDLWDGRTAERVVQSIKDRVL